MYGIFTYIYHENQPNVGKYTIHGSYGLGPSEKKKSYYIREGEVCLGRKDTYTADVSIEMLHHKFGRSPLFPLF